MNTELDTLDRLRRVPRRIGRWWSARVRGIAKVGRRVSRFVVSRGTVRWICEAVAGGCFTWAGWEFRPELGAVVLGLVFLNWAYSPGGGRPGR